jgi:hypothetical protein
MSDIGDLIGQSENHHWNGDSRVEDDSYEVVKEAKSCHQRIFRF